MKNKRFSVLLLMSFIILNSSFLTYNSNISNLSLRIIRNYQQINKSDVYALEAYYFEKTTLNGEYVSYTDAIGVMFSFGHDDGWVPLASMAFVPENMRKPDRSSANEFIVEKYVRNVRATGGKDLESQTDLPPAINSLLNAFRRLELHGPLNYDMRKDYDFRVNEISENKMALQVTPKNKNSFAGKIFFNKTTLKIDSLYFDQVRWYSQPHRMIVPGWIKVHYAHSNNEETWPVKISGGFSVDGIELVTKLIALNTYPHHPDLYSNVSSKYRVYSDNPIVIYNAEEWNKKEKFLMEVLDTETYKFINDASIVRQFEKNAGKPYYSSVYEGEKIPDINSTRYIHVRQRIENGLLFR